jgi:Fe2+ transport system protein FeoA
MMSLDKVPLGTKGVVKQISKSSPIKRRLMDMGIRNMCRRKSSTWRSY